MKFEYAKSDIYLLLLYFGIALPVNCMDYADYDNKWHLVQEILLMLPMDLACTFLIIFWIFPTFFPKQQFLRLVLAALGVFVVLGVIWINIVCQMQTCNGNPNSLKGVYLGIVSVTESFSILGLFLIGKKLFDTQLKMVKIEKEQKESELLRLNAQIDPHFLFNNLNTIDSLIDTNPNAAKIYLNKLALLYRYLTTTKDHEVVELNEEIEFAQNYIYLLQSRFGDAYQFDINNEIEADEIVFIPPGALQTLLENIIKHNQSTPKKPIKSRIHLTNDSIVVSNNLVKRDGNIDSTGTGLKNLNARYKLLTDKGIKIETGSNFQVTLPLIKQIS